MVSPTEALIRLDTNEMVSITDWVGALTNLVNSTLALYATLVSHSVNLMVICVPSLLRVDSWA